MRYHDWRIRFDPRDIWVGVFWERTYWWGCAQRGGITVYICLIPMLPIRLRFKPSCGEEEDRDYNPR